MLKNLGLLILRLTVGVLMAGHGAQKLFGWFSGPGLKGTHGFMESLGMKPGHVWGTTAAVGEFSGGVLTALGLFHPVGPQNVASAMAVATRRAHWGKPIWASSGGAELALTNGAVALSLVLLGPGKFSLDHIFGIKLPRWLVVLTWVNHVAVTGAALFRPEVAQQAMDKVMQAAPQFGGATAPAQSDPDLEVETVSLSEASEKQQAGI